jgi:CheY-like chemotaxis protein
MLKRLIGEDIDVAWLPGRGLVRVEIDPAQVDQILANLLVNARDAVSGKGRVTIETKNFVMDDVYCARHLGAKPGSYVMLAVSDDGRGMDQETLAHIFEPFFTTKEAGKGTGLGLATVYGIVKQNGGFISAYSEPGTGTTFKVYIPRCASDAVPVELERPAKAAEGGTETILLVEDDPMVLEAGALMLRELGYTVLPADTPDKAVRLAGKHAGGVHLLVTDVVMPGMNGRDLSRLLRSQYPGLRTLYLSGYTASVIATGGVLEQGVHFLQKPFSLNSLAEKVREALKGND